MESVMNIKEFKEMIRKCNEYETVYLKNGMIALVKIFSIDSNCKPNKISLYLDLDNSFRYCLNVRKAVYRKISKFCTKHSMQNFINNDYDGIVIKLHSKKDLNRLFDLFQFLNGRKLLKSAMNNNMYMI